MPVHAMLVSPPLVKSLGQPSLGVAMLVGAGQAAGHTVQSLDLSARWLLHLLGQGTAQPAPGPFLGDHDRHSHLTRPAQQAWLTGLLPAGPDHSWTDGLTMRMDHGTALRLAREGLHRPAGQWLARELRRHEHQHGRPAVVGVSVMFAGQVLAALALTTWVREHWPAARVVWGGPHVTALQPELLADPRYAAAGVEAFVFGYAEQTWVDILDAVDAGGPLPPEAVPAGPPPSLAVRPGRALHLAASAPQSLRKTPPQRARDNAAVLPVYQELESHRFGRLTLPVQLSRGCAYGRCAQCTYPWVEGGYRPLPLASTLEHAVQMAIQNKAVLALKDALVVPPRLQQVASVVAGRVQWAACTKLHRRLDHAFLQQLAAGGCRTLEVGLETLTEAGQLLLDKRQGTWLLERFLDAADAAGIAVVVNYMMGLPGVSPDEESRGLARLEGLLEAHA